MTPPDAARILIVEDDRFLRRACEASLTQRGFTVVTAATAGRDSQWRGRTGPRGMARL